MTRQGFRRILSFALGTLAACLVYADAGDLEAIGICRSGTREQVARFLKMHGDPDKAIGSYKTPFVLAIEQNPHPEVISLMIDAGAKVNARDAEGITPLVHSARNSNHPPIAVALIKGGADPNGRDGAGLTPLMHAAERNLNSEMVTALVKAGADVNAKGGDRGGTALFLVRNNHNADVTRALIAAGADLEARDAHGCTPLSLIVRRKDLLEILLKTGANVNARDNEGVTPLMRAVSAGADPPIISMLLSAGAEVNAVANDGTTPLGFARRSPLPWAGRIAAMLVSAGAVEDGMRRSSASTKPATDPSIRKVAKALGVDDERLPYTYADLLRVCKQGTPEQVAEVLASGVEPGPHPSSADPSPLMLAAMENPNPDVIRRLIAAGAKVDAASGTGATALMCSALNARTEVAQALLDAGANAKAADKDGNTSLHYCAMLGRNPAIASLLIKAGADINAKDTKAKTALDLARERKHKAMMDALTAAGAKEAGK